MVVVSELIEELQQFGFTRYEASCYLALVREGVMTAPSISKQSGVPKSKIYEIMTRLLKMGVIEEFPGTPMKFKARTPDNVINIILEQKRKEMENLGTIASDLRVKLNALLKSSEKTLMTSDNILWTVNGRNAFHEKFIEMGNRSKGRVYVITPYFSRHPLMEECITNAIKRGVVFQGLTSINESNVDRVKFYSKLFAEIRNFDGELPLTIIIIDDKECIYRMDYVSNGQTNYIGVHSNNPGLIKAFMQYWEGLWKISAKFTN